MTEAQPSNAQNSAERPEPTDADRAENVKHLEMIQAAITRLASNSFFIKGWTLTLAAASFGFAVNRVDWRIAAIGSVIILGFWTLDAYYVRQERLFRHLFNTVRRDVTTDPNARFSMNLVPFRQIKTVRHLRVFFSITLIAFYPLLVIGGVALSIIFAREP